MQLTYYICNVHSFSLIFSFLSCDFLVSHSFSSISYHFLCSSSFQFLPSSCSTLFFFFSYLLLFLCPHALPSVFLSMFAILTACHILICPSQHLFFGFILLRSIHTPISKQVLLFKIPASINPRSTTIAGMSQPQVQPLHPKSCPHHHIQVTQA
ncbi:unnamed protein product [Acanthosepion pharaonis]|uniref:Uncharacterized protein n=1 Tax=Acanthosepion pharaonis TaxID=158019 RepID=A0A812E5X0_ACAPH|nr:unnamed protein product [Sepia pharaonis]